MTDLVDAPPGHAPAAPGPRFLHDVYEAAAECNKCSLCQAVCPTYVTNPVEWETARGRVGLVRDAIEGRLDLADIEEGPLSTCLTCDNCVAACAPRVPTGEIVSRARQQLHAERGQPMGRSLVMRSVLSRPGGMRFVHGLSRFGQITGLGGLARRAGLTRLMGTPGAMSEHVGPLPRLTAYHRVKQLPPPTLPVRGRYAFLMCCYQDVAAPDATEATLRVLLANGFAIDVPKLSCSGLPARTLGDRDAMLDLGTRNLERLQPLNVQGYIGDVASCTEHYRRYADFLGDDRSLGGDARRVSASTWIASHFLATQGMTALLGRLRWRITIDEPCSYPLNHEVRSAPHRLLAQVPGLEIVPLHEAAMCCGGAGTYFHSQPARSAAILERKFDSVRATGAEVLVTENISCITQLRKGARVHAPGVRVMHVFEVLQAALEAAERQGATGDGR